MSESKNPDEFYENLKKQLQDTALWPSEYLYKFIVPTQGEQVQQIEKIFDNKITDNFSPEELEKVIQEGKKRYEKNIPPGYKDIKKP